jgi:hypothetical protein
MARQNRADFDLRAGVPFELSIGHGPGNYHQSAVSPAEVAARRAFG